MFTLAMGLASLAGAWQDEALSSLADKAVDISALPLQTYLAEYTHEDFQPGDSIYADFDLWKKELPELLRRTAETGDATLSSAKGFTALQAACLVGDAQLIEALVAQGAPVNARPKDWKNMNYLGDAPLTLLLRNQSLSLEERTRLGRLLLEKGADPDVPASSSNYHPNHHFQWTEPLFSSLQTFRSADWPLCMLLLDYGEQDMVKRFSKNNMKLPIYWARRDFKIAALKRGVPEKAFTGEKGITILKDAVMHGDAELVKLALEKGGYPTDTTRRYYDHAIFLIPTEKMWYEPDKKDTYPEISPESAVEVAKLLLDHGANINALDYEGNGVRIHYAKKGGPIGEALSAYFKERGAVLHPDAKPARKRKK